MYTNYKLLFIIYYAFVLCFVFCVVIGGLVGTLLGVSTSSVLRISRTQD